MEERRFIQNVLALLAVKSFTGDTKKIKRCQEKLIEMAKTQYNFNAYLAGKEQVVIIEPKNLIRPIQLGLVVHLDTVPFDLNKWNYNPLGEVKDGRIYGRGVIDDKGAIIQCMEALYESSDKIQPSWQIIVGSSEEGEWTDMAAYLEEKPELPLFMITVDGDGIQNGCRGTLNLEMIFEREKVDVPNESKLLRLEVIDGIENVVPSEAIADVGGFLIQEDGVSAHSSEPELGKNALIMLSKELENYQYIYEQFPNLFRFLNTYDANGGLGSEDPNCSCPTMCSMYGDSVTINLNKRLGAGVTKEDVDYFVATLEEQYGCKTRIKELILPVYLDPESRPFKLMLEAYSYIAGVNTKVTFARGTGYNATLPNCAIFGPRFAPEHDEADFCHCDDESRSIEAMILFYRMLVHFIKMYLN
jgi:succinyl-diaminopimelate desuccinylase